MIASNEANISIDDNSLSDQDHYKESNKDTNKKDSKSDIDTEGDFTEKSEKTHKVKFSKKVVFIDYEEESFPEEIRVIDKDGKPEKHKKFNYLQYLNKLKNNRWKPKKAIHYYYNGVRDDKIPKKLLSSFKKTNYFSEQDKEIGLKKLNEFLEECNENSIDDVEAKNKSRIGKLTIYYIPCLIYIYHLI